MTLHNLHSTRIVNSTVSLLLLLLVGTFSEWIKVEIDIGSQTVIGIADFKGIDICIIKDDSSSVDCTELSCEDLDELSGTGSGYCGKLAFIIVLGLMGACICLLILAMLSGQVLSLNGLGNERAPLLVHISKVIASLSVLRFLTLLTYWAGDGTPLIGFYCVLLETPMGLWLFHVVKQKVRDLPEDDDDSQNIVTNPAIQLT